MADVEVADVQNLGEGDEDPMFLEDTQQNQKEEAEATDEEENDRWINVKELKNLSLNELKTVSNDGGKADTDKRLDIPITKVVVRRLPPQISIQDYLQELSEIPGFNYIRLVPPNEDLPTRIGRRSSIYINFESEQEAFWFKEKYNNMKFFDDRGNSYIACVDFSFIQDVPQDPKADPQQGTLEESEIFKDFERAYEEEPWAFTMHKPENVPTPEAMLDEILNKKIIEPENTPLLQFLRERSMKKDLVRKERDQRRKERDVARRKQKEEILKRRLKEKDEAAKRKLKDKDEKKRRETNEEGKDGDKVDREPAPREKGERRRERDRERQRERDRERRLRREKERQEREKGRGSDEQQVEDKSGGSKPSTDKEKDLKAKGKITYSRTGNVTRWSENSGPRKNDKGVKEESKRSQEQINQTKRVGSSDKLAVEKSPKDTPQAKDVAKATFGKPFPSKQGSDSTSEKKPEAVEAKEVESEAPCKKNSDLQDSQDRSKKETEGGGPVKKRIVKRIIKVKKVKEPGETSEEIGNDLQTGASESKPKKIVRVVKKCSIKSEDQSGSKSSDNGSKKPELEATTKTETQPGGDRSEKDRKNKKGRPEIQIYRPGSLRGGSGKPNPAPASGGDKERKSDNGS